MKRIISTIIFLSIVHLANAQFSKPIRGDITVEPFISILNIPRLQEEQNISIISLGFPGFMVKYFNRDDVATRIGASLGLNFFTPQQVFKISSFPKIDKVVIDGIAIEAGRERHFAGGKNSSVYWGPFFGIGSNFRFDDIRFSGGAHLGANGYFNRVFLGAEAGLGIYALTKPITVELDGENFESHYMLGVHMKVLFMAFFLNP